MPSRRQFLRETGRTAAIAGLASTAGCASLPGSDGTATPAHGRKPVVDWRTTFGTERAEYEPVVTTPVDGVVAVGGVTVHRTDDGGGSVTPLLRGHDATGGERWRHRYDPPASETSDRADDATASGTDDADDWLTGWVVSDVTAVTDGFVAGLARVTADQSVRSPTLVGLAADGTERWSRSLSGVGAPLLASPPGDGSLYAALNSPEGGAVLSVRSDGAVAWRRTVAVSQFATPADLRADPDGGLSLAGKARDDVSASATVVRFASDGSLLDDRRYADEVNLANPYPIVSRDGSFLALNTLDNAFTGGCVVVGLGDDGTAEWRTTFTGWHVVDTLTGRPFSPADGAVLAMGDAGEGPRDEGGAQLVAIRRDGSVGWTADRLERPTWWDPYSLSAGGGHLFVGAAVRVDGANGRDVGLARFVPASKES